MSETHSFNKFDVPTMPRYVQSYTKRGNGAGGDTEPVYQQTRWGNARYRGGMGAYLNELEDSPEYFNSLKQKKGNTGIHEMERWTPGYDWRGGFGVSSLDAMKNHREFTRGGSMRKGGPRRGDYIERPHYWFEVARPGLTTSRVSQTNENYVGVYEHKRNTPFITRDNDMLVLREMIEKNPWHIPSHSAAMAKSIYDKEYK